MDMDMQVEMGRLHVAIIDQNEFIREGIHYLLDKEMTYQIVSSSDCFIQFQEFGPNKELLPIDLLLIDIRSFFASQREIGQMVAKMNGRMKVLVMLSEKDRLVFSKQMASRASFPFYVSGFLDKGIGMTHLLSVIPLVVQAGLYVQPKHLNEWTEVANGQMAHATKQARPTHIYTKREWDIIELLVKGYRNQEIADYLRISDKTVKNHLSNIFKKMQVNDRVKVVLHAIRNEWVDL